MAYVLCGNHELRYHPCVEELGKFVLQHPNYFATLAKILLRSKNSMNVIDSLISKAVDEGSITPETVGDFKRLLFEFIEFDEKQSGNFTGKLTEYIVAHIPPQTFIPTMVKRIKHCQIRDTENECLVGGGNNFDLGVYNEYKEFKDLQLELIECKTNIENFLFKYPKKESKSELNRKAKQKLDYIKAVKEELQDCKHVATVLATLSQKKSITRSKEALQSNGYGFIIIFDYYIIRNALRKTY